MRNFLVRLWRNYRWQVNKERSGARRELCVDLKVCHAAYCVLVYTAVGLFFTPSLQGEKRCNSPASLYSFTIVAQSVLSLFYT